MATFRKEFGLFSTAFLLLLSLLLSVYTKHNPESVKLGAVITSAILYPIQGSVNYVHSGVSDIWKNYIDLVNVKQDNQGYKSENEKLKLELIELSAAKDENIKLKELLNLKVNTQRKSITAKVLAYDPSTWIDQIIIDKGLFDNVQQGQVVISNSGLVGQIVMVGAKTAHIQLLSDRRSSVDAVAQRTRVRGIVDGDGNFKTKWNYVPNDADLLVGDLIVSSGLDGVFSEGLVIGTITEINKPKIGELFKKVRLKIAAEYSQLEYVQVLANE